MSEHGSCPACEVSLDGGLIWDTFFAQSGDDAEADRISGMYGATRTAGRWGRQIGIYSNHQDRTVGYRCPDCFHEWER